MNTSAREWIEDVTDGSTDVEQGRVFIAGVDNAPTLADDAATLADDAPRLADDAPTLADDAATLAAESNGHAAPAEVAPPASEDSLPEPAEVELTAADLGGGDGDRDLIVVNVEDRLLEALPELARLAAAAWVRGAGWGLGMGLRASARLARATVDPETASELASEFGTGLRGYARELLGINELDDRVRALTPPGEHFAGSEFEAGDVAPEQALRIKGAALLRRSADVGASDDVHPAFGHVLAELAPDEARILRLVFAEGPQPVVDIRAANLIGVGSQLVAPNLNMIGQQAGCRDPDRAGTYLGNLQRLGLIVFSDQPLEDNIAYQVLEAQPHVLGAIKETARAKAIQRSLRLSEFGEAFCAACIPTDEQELYALTHPAARRELEPPPLVGRTETFRPEGRARGPSGEDAGSDA